MERGIELNEGFMFVTPEDWADEADARAARSRARRHGRKRHSKVEDAALLAMALAAAGLAVWQVFQDVPWTGGFIGSIIMAFICTVRLLEGPHGD